MENREKTTEQLKEDLRKTREELAIQKWGIEKTLEGMKVLVKELIQKGEEAEKAKAQDEALLASIGDGVIAIDMDGRIILMNKAAQTMLGWHPAELLDKSFFETIPIEDEKGKPVPLEQQPISRALVGTTTTGHSYYYIRKDKTKFPAAMVATPVIIDKKIVGAIEVFRDITKEKEIDKVKTEFVSIASHQLRTPLIGIQWLAELLKKEKLTDKGQEYLNDIRISIQRLNKLVELLLNVSRLEEGKIEISPQSIDVVNFIKKIVDSLAILNSKKRLSLTFTADEPKIMALTDVGALQNIAQTILPNATEYTPEGGKIEVKIKKHGRMFLLTVSDTGIGIPKKDQGRMFQEFARASNAGRIKAAGMGLGLWIAKQATELLGGKIWFESQENRGTTFFVELPLKSKSIDGTKKLV